MSKILETLAARRIQHYLEINNILPHNQGGFRFRRSVEDQVAAVLQDAHNSWSCNHDHLLLTLDVRKAFDTVWTDGLIYKIFEKAGIRGALGLWLADYLKGRSTRVTHNGVHSSSVPMPNGVPQFSAQPSISYLCP
jgi:hypothetical protein